MRPLQARGFTLVEVLVALVGLALMAGLSWRGLDSMMRTRDASQQRVDEVAVLQTALAQWRTDLDAESLLVVFNTAEHELLLDNLDTGRPAGTPPQEVASHIRPGTRTRVGLDALITCSCPGLSRP